MEQDLVSNSTVSKDVGWWEWAWYNKGTGPAAYGGCSWHRVIGRQSIDDSGDCMHRWCSDGAQPVQPCYPPAAALLQPSCCPPAAALLLLSR